MIKSRFIYNTCIYDEIHHIYPIVFKYLIKIEKNI